MPSCINSSNINRITTRHPSTTSSFSHHFSLNEGTSPPWKQSPGFPFTSGASQSPLECLFLCTPPLNVRIPQRSILDTLHFFIPYCLPRRCYSHDSLVCICFKPWPLKHMSLTAHVTFPSEWSHHSLEFSISKICDAWTPNLILLLCSSLSSLSPLLSIPNLI